MRTIKFRGKRKDNGEWVYGFFWAFQRPNTSWYKTYITPKYESIKIEVVPESVGQFTGKLDDNKTEIYRGDIIENADYVPDAHARNNKYHIFFRIWIREVIWTDGSPFQPSMGWGGIEGESIKVIGNKTDNPELSGE